MRQSLPTSTHDRPLRPDDGAAAHRAAPALDEHSGCHVAKNDAAAHRAALALDDPPGCPDPGAIAAFELFVEFVHQLALLEVEPPRTAMEQPNLLQHDHVLIEARWRAGVVTQCQRRRAAAKLQSVIGEEAACAPALSADRGEAAGMAR